MWRGGDGSDFRNFPKRLMRLRAPLRAQRNLSNRNATATIHAAIAGRKNIHCSLVEYSTLSPGCKMSSIYRPIRLILKTFTTAIGSRQRSDWFRQRIDPTRFRIAFPHRKCRNLRSFVRPNTGNVRPVRRRDLDLQQAFGTTIAESMCFALRSVIGRSKEVRLIRLIAIAGFALPVTGCDTYAYSTAGQPDHGSRGCLRRGQDTS